MSRSSLPHLTWQVGAAVTERDFANFAFLDPDVPWEVASGIRTTTIVNRALTIQSIAAEYSE